MTKVYYKGTVPSTCDTCGQPLREKFVDGATRMGPWACMCSVCFKLGPGFNRLGIGVGQEYTEQPDGKWLKTGG